MAKINLVNTDLSKRVALGPVTILSFHGANASGADVYIQFHESPVVANGDVPAVKSFLAQSLNAFSYNLPKPISLSELTIALSSTEANLTAVASGSALDLTVIVQSENLADGTETVTNDLATGTSSITPFANAVASNGKRLLRVDYTNKDGADRYLMLFADTSPAAGATPLWVSPKIANNGTYTGRFGDQGRECKSIGSDAAIDYGCYLVQSSTAATLTATVSTVSYIRSIHR